MEAVIEKKLNTASVAWKNRLIVNLTPKNYKKLRSKGNVFVICQGHGIQIFSPGKKVDMLVQRLSKKYSRKQLESMFDEAYSKPTKSV